MRPRKLACFVEEIFVIIEEGAYEKTNMIIKVYLIYTFVRNGMAQYDPYAYNSYSALLQGIPANVYQEPTYDNQWNVQQNPNLEEVVDYPNPAEYVTCSCDTCNNPKPCCKEFCKTCPPAYNYNQLKYVFMPFSYSFDYPKSKSADDPRYEETTTEKPTTTTKTTTPTTTTTIITTTTTELTTTTQTTTTETNNKHLNNRHAAFRIYNREEDAMYNPYPVKDREQFMLTSLRRTKPNWIPNYGIVPISDGFAEKLMLQLRSMKVLHPRKNNIRTVDEMTPV